MSTHSIRLIRKAAKIVSKIADELPSVIKPSVTEKSVASYIRKRIKALGGERESFRIIVSSGKRSSLIHGYATDKVIREGDAVLVDFGAKYEGFVSDISRTYFIGKPTKKQKNIYNIVKNAQLLAIRSVRAGISGSKVDLKARDHIRAKGFVREFPHSTGHGVGQKVHEYPRISWKREHILKRGMVITIEPGIYIKGFGGVRIEDMVLVKKDGYEVLTTAKK